MGHFKPFPLFYWCQAKPRWIFWSIQQSVTGLGIDTGTRYSFLRYLGTLDIRAGDQ